MERADELRREISRLTTELHDLEDVDRARALEPLVGRFFKASNCYSLPKGPQDYWWLYARVNHVGEQGRGVVTLFETDKNGAVEIRLGSWISSDPNRFVEITREEYESAWRQLLDTIEGFAARPRPVVVRPDQPHARRRRTRPPAKRR